MNRLLIITAVALAGVLAAACDIPPDDSVTPLQDELPGALDTTTTSTTTTSVVPSSTDPPPQISQETTTTIVQVTDVDVFYVIGVSDDLQQLTLSLPDEVTIQSVIRQLENPPPDAASFNLRTSVPVDLVEAVSVERGVATVSLSESVLNRIPSSQESRAIAQIVLTLTRFVTAESGIGQVRFDVDGEAIPVFLPDRGTSEPGEPVAFDDFRSLILTNQGSATTIDSAPDSTDVESAPPGGTLPTDSG